MSDIQSISQNNYILQMPPASSYMNLSGLEYDGDKISGYSGSAFKAGDEFPQSATDAIEYVTATSGDINTTIDNVSANSGAWGGSALPVSAGPGVKISLQNDTLVFSTDETVLWSGSCKALSSVNLSESYKNFEKIKICGTHLHGAAMSKEVYVDDITAGLYNEVTLESWVSWGDATRYMFSISMPCDFTSDTVLTTRAGRFIGYWDNTWQTTTASDPSNTTLTKVIGINRVAG